MNRKILLVDDEPHILDGLRRHLSKRFEVHTAQSGDEALLLLDGHGPFAAIISDLRMPGMSGLELLAEMRARAAKTVRMVLSGSNDFETAIAAVNEGAIFRFLTKPVAPDVLTEAIESAIMRYEMEKRVPGSFDPSIDLLRDVRALHDGLLDGQFRVFFQPQCDLSSGGITGAEALIRWQHPRNGLLLPGQFFGTAEAGGLMGEITNWVLEATCRQAGEWKRAGMPPIRLAVNVSALDLQRSTFADLVQETLNRHGLTADWLEIELTEGAAVQDMDSIRAILEKLINMGVKLSIDDFGTGYASLGWLRHLPFSKLKIDRSFISEIDSKPEAYRFLESMVHMGTECKMSILAEGVETLPQMDKAKLAGCGLMQGFFLAMPLPAGDFPGWLKKHGTL
ncbi:MAG: EAL domain-containing protein [Alphaproteobacteria bacterium]|nr:EAL domain-containing protein [Alphaproteobacteria bacterium]